MSNFRLTYTNWIEFFFHTSGTRTTVLSIIIFVWIVSFLIILPLHRLSLRKEKKAKQDLINSIDRLIYLLSKAQYSLSE